MLECVQRVVVYEYTDGALHRKVVRGVLHCFTQGAVGQDLTMFQDGGSHAYFREKALTDVDRW